MDKRAPSNELLKILTKEEKKIKFNRYHSPVQDLILHLLHSLLGLNQEIALL